MTCFGVKTPEARTLIPKTIDVPRGYPLRVQPQMKIDSMAAAFYSCGVALLEDFVRALGMSALVIVVSVSLIGIPVMATPANPASAPLGWVLQAERAHVGADITSGGATIYDGDRLETQEDGTLRARLGNSQMYLRPSTLTEVHGLSNGFSASLLRGTVVASAPEGQTFQVLANGAIIRPVGMKASVAQVTWVNAKELLLTSNVGAIEVSLDGGDVKTIEAGNSFRMEIQPEAASPSQNGSGGTPAGGRNRAIYIWITAASVAAGVGIWRAMISN
jgi:hypothetical protein